MITAEIDLGVKSANTKIGWKPKQQYFYTTGAIIRILKTLQMCIRFDLSNV